MEQASIEDFWEDGSSASRLLSLRKKENEEKKREAYLKTWKGQREEEERQRNAIAAYAAGYRKIFP